MNGIMNENQLTIIKEYEFDKPDFHEIDYLLDDIIKDCRNKYFHTFEINLFMIFNLQIFLILKKSISQLLIDLWNLKLNSTVRIKKSKRLEKMVLHLFK